MLVDWFVEYKLKEDYIKRLETYCDEIVSELAKPIEEQEHFLLEARDETVHLVWEYRQLSTPVREKQLHDELIEAIYSNDFDTFLCCFFKNLEVCNNHYIYMENFEGDNWNYEAIDNLQKLLAEVCIPEKTFVQLQVSEDDYLPWRDQLKEGGLWVGVYPELVWPENK
jgi:hypothetical protein